MGSEGQVAFQAQSSVIAVIAVKTFWMIAQVAGPELRSAEQLWRQTLMPHVLGQVWFLVLVPLYPGHLSVFSLWSFPSDVA